MDLQSPESVQANGVARALRSTRNNDGQNIGPQKALVSIEERRVVRAAGDATVEALGDPVPTHFLQRTQLQDQICNSRQGRFNHADRRFLPQHVHQRQSDARVDQRLPQNARRPRQSSYELSRGCSDARAGMGQRDEGFGNEGRDSEERLMVLGRGERDRRQSQQDSLCQPTRRVSANDLISKERLTEERGT